MESKKEYNRKYPKQLKTQFTAFWWEKIENHCKNQEHPIHIAKFVREATIEKYNEIYNSDKLTD
jgi:hypothetical protein